MQKLEEENQEKKIDCPRCKNSKVNDCFGCLGEGKIDSDFQICPVKKIYILLINHNWC